MRWGLALAAAVTAGLAAGLVAAPVAADDRGARRKATPDKFAQAAGEAFAAAVTADQAGDLRTALGLYQKAFEISPHPSTVYNLADVQRRLLRLADAIKSYETYLAMLPGAPDRRDVEAILEQLARTPGTLLLATSQPSDPRAVDFKNAYVLVDGEIKIRPGTAPAPLPDNAARTGFVLQVPPGAHVVDVVTAITHGNETCRVEVGGRAYCNITAKPRIDGRLVVTASERSLSARLDPKARSLVGERTEAPPGKRKLLVRDRSFECRAVPIEVPPGGDVLHVFLGTVEYEVQRCRALEVKQNRLRFAP